MLVLLESNKKFAQNQIKNFAQKFAQKACLFFEISVVKVGISYYNDILKTQL